MEAEKVEAEEKTRELEQMLPLLLLKQLMKMWSNCYVNGNVIIVYKSVII